MKTNKKNGCSVLWRKCSGVPLLYCLLLASPQANPSCRYDTSAYMCLKNKVPSDNDGKANAQSGQKKKRGSGKKKKTL